MNRLPDMMVLDFCEYLKRKTRNSATVLELLSDDRNSDKLYSLADEYLCNHQHTLKAVIHRFIDSEHFDRCLRRLRNEYGENFDHLSLEHIRKTIRNGFPYCCRECGCHDFLMFLEHHRHDLEFSEYRADKWALINNVRHSLQDDSKETMLHCMQSLGIDLSTEIDFLEWLIRTQKEPLRIYNLSISVFEMLVDDYLSECGGSAREKKQLVKSFKKSDSYFFNSLLERLLPNFSEKGKRNLRYVLDRYYSQKIPFKCVILPLAAETAEHKRLINDYWRDLHNISADYLDVYYSETDYGKSGSEIQNRISSLPQNLKSTFPCIILWSDNIKEAQSIDIRELSNKEIVAVINAVVNEIKCKKTLENIVKEINKMTQKIREKDRPITKNSVYIGGDNRGVAVAENSGSISNVINYSCTSSEFSKEVSVAIEKIRQIEEITIQQQEMLVEILSETKKAFDSAENADKERSKSRFKDAMCFLGNASVKVLSALSSLANLSKFLGIVGNAT